MMPHGEMNEMTLPSRHRIRNSSPGGVRPSPLPFSRGSLPPPPPKIPYLYERAEKNKCVSLKLKCQSGDEPAISDIPSRQP